MGPSLPRRPWPAKNALRNPTHEMGPTQGPTREAQASHWKRSIWARYQGDLWCHLPKAEGPLVIHFTEDQVKKKAKPNATVTFAYKAILT